MYKSTMRHMRKATNRATRKHEIEAARKSGAPRQDDPLPYLAMRCSRCNTFHFPTTRQDGNLANGKPNVVYRWEHMCPGQIHSGGKSRIKPDGSAA